MARRRQLPSVDSNWWYDQGVNVKNRFQLWIHKQYWKTTGVTLPRKRKTYQGKIKTVGTKKTNWTWKVTQHQTDWRKIKTSKGTINDLTKTSWRKVTGRGTEIRKRRVGGKKKDYGRGVPKTARRKGQNHWGEAVAFLKDGKDREASKASEIVPVRIEKIEIRGGKPSRKYGGRENPRGGTKWNWGCDSQDITGINGRTLQ